MNLSKVITNGFEAYKSKLGLQDKDLIISKADSNAGFKNNNRLFWLFVYFDRLARSLKHLIDIMMDSGIVGRRSPHFPVGLSEDKISTLTMSNQE